MRDGLLHICHLTSQPNPWASRSYARHYGHLRLHRLSNYGLLSVRPGMSEAALNLYGQRTAVPADNVEVQFYVAQYAQINMVDQHYGFEGYMRAWWNDPRMRYNGTGDGGITNTLSLGYYERLRIWKPVFYWEGAKHITLPTSESGTGELLEVYPTGDIWWSRQVQVTLGCPVAQTLCNMPFDTQTCQFVLGMYADTTDSVVVKWKAGRTGLANWDGGLDASVCLAEYHPTKLVQTDLLQVYSTANYSYAKATIDFTRSPTTFIYIYLVPAILFCALGYMGFYIDPDATPARVALGMLVLVVVVQSSIALTNRLPTTVEPVWMTRFMQTSLTFNAIAMVEQILTSFGNSAKKWLKEQHNMVAISHEWKKAMYTHRDKLLQLFKEWDTDGDVQS